MTGPATSPTVAGLVGEALGGDAQGQAISPELAKALGDQGRATASRVIVDLLLDMNRRMTGPSLIAATTAVLDGWVSGSLIGYLTIGDPAVSLDTQRLQLKHRLCQLVDQLPAPRIQVGGS